MARPAVYDLRHERRELVFEAAERELLDGRRGLASRLAEQPVLAAPARPAPALHLHPRANKPP
jgi:hypothetical protein